MLYEDEHGQREFSNLLKEKPSSARLRKSALGLAAMIGASAFSRTNAGVIRFDETFNVTFKVETHNRPSAIEPYGGANTGLGGVIRDTLGTGMGAKPICSTVVFCFAPPDTKESELPPGVNHPRTLDEGRCLRRPRLRQPDGIPTVNGAVWFDSRYIGNRWSSAATSADFHINQSFKQGPANDYRGDRWSQRTRRHSRGDV